MELPLEGYDDEIKVFVLTLSCIFLVFNVIALVALSRTRGTPKPAKFLSSGLLVFDFMAITCYTVRKCVEDHMANILIQTIGSAWFYLAFMTVGIMSLERLFLFRNPHFYMLNITPTIFKKLVLSVWVCLACIYFFIRYGLCYTFYPQATFYDVIGKCNNASFVFYGVCLFLINVVSILSYLNIFRIIRANGGIKKPMTIAETANSFKQYKSTSVVLVFIVVIVFTSLAITCVISLKLDTVPLRIAFDAINIFNCVMDPCMYVFWFKECRMETMKMFSFLDKRIHPRMERMRMEIFDIVISEEANTRRNNHMQNKVYPLFGDSVVAT